MNDKRIARLKLKTIARIEKFKLESLKIPKVLRNDTDFLIEAIKIINVKYTYVDKAIEHLLTFVDKNNIELMTKLIEADVATSEYSVPLTIKSLNELYRDSKTFMTKLLDIYPNAEIASDGLKNDVEYMSKAILKKPTNIKYASERLCGDKDFMTFAIDNVESVKDGYTLVSPLFYASKELKNDKSFVLEAVKKSGYAFKSSSEQLRDDTDVIYTAVKVNGGIIKEAGRRFRYTVPEVVKAVGLNLSAIDYVEPEIMREVANSINQSRETSSREIETQNINEEGNDLT